MSSFNQRGCYGCGGPLDGLLCRQYTCEWCGNNLRDEFCLFGNSRAGNSFIYDSKSNSFDNLPNYSYHPPHPTYKTYSCESCGNDSHFGYDCPPRQYKPEEIQELFRKLFNDVQNIHEELAEYINTPSWNCPAFYNNGEDDDEHYAIAISPDFLITDSLIMGDEHLGTILEKESEEFIKSSVENLVPNPSEFEDECECDVPDCDDSQTTNFSMFSNPLFDDSTSSDEESSHVEVIHEMSFKTYSNPLFDLDGEIISSEFNPIHNEDLDSTLKIIVLIPSLIFLNHYSIMIP
nr:hypothetical protein [Tanacetum cinerariifolium]